MVGRRGVSRRTARRTSRRVSRRQDAMRRAFTSENQEPAPPQGDEVADEDARYAKLREAKELLDAGILSQEEFEAEKSKILGS